MVTRFTASTKVQEIETQKQDGKWHRWFNCSRLKIQLISKKSLEKNQRKGAQKKKLIETQCKNNISTVAEKYATTENIPKYALTHDCDITVADDGWIISKTVKKLEVIQNVVLKEEFKLNDLLMNIK